MKNSILVLSVLFGLNATAATTTYTCTPGANNTNTNTYAVTVGADSAVTLVDVQDSNKAYPMTLDTAYKPRGNNADYNRYGCNYVFDEEYQSDYLVSKSITAKEATGSLKIFSRGEGFFDDYFTCSK